jgi:hypothetical protein
MRFNFEMFVSCDTKTFAQARPAEALWRLKAAELLASAKATVECWIAEGVLGKKAQRWFANIRSDAQTAEPQKSITSAVQNSSAEWRADQ